MKKLLLKLWYWVMKLLKGLDKAVDRLVPIASAVVEGVKKGIETGSIDIIGEVVKTIIPGDFDDFIINKAIALARKHIPTISMQLNIIANIEDPEKQLIALFAKLKYTEGELWQKFCTQLAQQILVDLSNTDDTPNEITWGESGVYVELYYKTFIQNAA